MPPAEELYVGLMSGTSLDAIDAVLLRCGARMTLVANHNHTLPDDVRQRILALCLPGDNEIDRMGELHVVLGELFAEATLTLLAQANVRATDVRAIGSHGQTIRHRPGAAGFSVQIGSADIIATRTGISVVTDFRNRDMALGGQGAPLVPAFHRAMWGHLGHVAIVNVGGMANLTVLHQGEVRCGFDTGPGNVLMDLWAQQHLGHPFDRNGAWAASGTVQPALLDRLQRDPYFAAPPPKSTGREHFNEGWLTSRLRNESAADVQATLLELTASSINAALSTHDVERVLVCGGGAHNHGLMRRLGVLSGKPVQVTDDVGMPADWVEGAAFAWLARARLHGLPGNVCSVTGAQRPAVLGAVYLP
jgi:anhydro-N-acetylmuramic acid kinase